MRASLADSFSSSLDSGMPVQRETMNSMSTSPTDCMPLPLFLLPLPLHLLLAVLEDLFLLAERGGLLELLRLEVHVLLADDPLQLLLDLLDLGAAASAP